ncbi:hypothetical protein PGTUg99_024321 [Puccinia graminis f. sp. tritici]|uniref:Tet-like 2OG-Fe(II) oxygenase domain-containing protein n=2 Tax=Puccinia graminis f. sp. tritici TaxID=56615 RepID=A0A5B0SAD3_PUCGR|nr:hypothetical protein PGTUg99_024321 [Puccinia graminis f. sp. tritici]
MPPSLSSSSLSELESTLSDIESTLSSISLRSETDVGNLINNDNISGNSSDESLSDSDLEQIINKRNLPPRAKPGGVDSTSAKITRKKRIRKKSLSMKAYQHQRSQRKRPARRAKKKQHGIHSLLTTYWVPGKMCTTSRTPVPIDLFPAITAEYRQKKEARAVANERFKQHGGQKPSTKTIHKRNPTPNEIEDAYRYVNDPSKFKLYDHGHVRAFDATQNDQLIADIHFIDLNKISESTQEDIQFLCLFLHKAKQFVNPVRSTGRSCGGVMFAIGWRKSMAKLEILGIYRNQKAIDKNPEAYAEHVKDSTRAGQILWHLFHLIANVALKHNQDFMTEHCIPAFFQPAFSTEQPSSPDSFFSSNLTFTTNGFYNHPHVDDKDEPSLPFAFLLSIPTFKRTGDLAFKVDGYNVKDGHFIFPECGFGIKFQPDMMCLGTFRQRDYIHGTLPPRGRSPFARLGMSMQIAAKVTRVADRVVHEDFEEKTDMHFGDVEFLLTKG